MESLIKRSDQLEVKLALEIASQVAAGLVAVHKQKLVHRATGITKYLENGGTLEVAQRSRTTKLYDRRGQKVLLCGALCCAAENFLKRSF